MFFPIGDDNVQGGYKPLFSYTLILVNVLVFLFEFSLQQDAAEAMVVEFGSIPWKLVRGRIYTPY